MNKLIFGALALSLGFISGADAQVHREDSVITSPNNFPVPASRLQLRLAPGDIRSLQEATSTNVNITGGSIGSGVSITLGTTTFPSIVTGDVTQGSTGFWRFTQSAGGSGMLFKDSTSNLFQLATGQALFYVPAKWNNHAAFSGAYTLSADTTIFQNNTYSGTLTGSPAVYSVYLQGTSSIAGQGQFTMLAANTFLAPGATGNTYSIDAQTGMTGATGGTGQELHSARYTTSVSFSMGGVLGTPSGTGIGSKSQIGVTSGSSYLNWAIGHQIGMLNASATTDNIYGSWIEEESTSAAVHDHIGLAILSDAATVGFKTALSFGAYSRGNGPCGSQACTLIGGTGAAGAGFTATNGVDWHLGTFSGNVWNDGHLTIDGSGNLATSGSVTASNGMLTTNITHTGSSGMNFIQNNASTSFVWKNSSLVIMATLDSSNLLSVGNISQITTGNWSFSSTVAANSIFFKASSGTPQVTIDTGAGSMTVLGLVVTPQIKNTGANLLLGSGAALATTSVIGHILVPTTAGLPTGAVGAAGQAALIVDTTNKKVCYTTGGGTWECSAAFTP